MSDDAIVPEFLNDWGSCNEFRKAFVAELSRDLSKSGCFEGYEEYLTLLAKELTEEETVELFAELQKSERPESEWRDDFLGFFSNLRLSEFPQPIIDESEARRIADEARNRDQFGLPEGGYPDVPF